MLGGYKVIKLNINTKNIFVAKINVVVKCSLIALVAKHQSCENGVQRIYGQIFLEIFQTITSLRGPLRVFFNKLHVILKLRNLEIGEISSCFNY